MPPTQQPTCRHERIKANDDGSLRLAVVADTHSALHPRAIEAMAALKPDAILHAGDIGNVHILDKLASLRVAQGDPEFPVFAVRGNIDIRLPGVADRLVVDIDYGTRLLLRILLLHVAVYGPKLRSEVAALARTEQATLVVCGHSHVPFIGRDRGIAVFNPGSAGPRRFNLPILFGTIDVSPEDVRLRHFNCEDGQPWAPP